MAEFPELGEHCAMDGCGQLDFLPVVCGACSRPFCKDHFFTDSHRCERANQDVVRAFFDRGVSAAFTCSLSDCKRRELVEIKCAGCQSHFCLKHRHKRDHGCPAQDEEVKTKKDMKGTKAVIANVLAAAKPRKARSVKNQRMAAKVQLMKLKMGATGNAGLPQQERVYLKAFLPKDGKARVCPVFVSSSWSLGRVVDEVAKASKVDNRYDGDGAPRLRLFRRGDGRNLGFCLGVGKEECLSEPMSKLINAEELFNGDAVVLEYLSTGSDAEYIDASAYKEA